MISRFRFRSLNVGFLFHCLAFHIAQKTLFPPQQMISTGFHRKSFSYRSGPRKERGKASCLKKTGRKSFVNCRSKRSRRTHNVFELLRQLQLIQLIHTHYSVYGAQEEPIILANLWLVNGKMINVGEKVESRTNCLQQLSIAL